MRLAPGHGPGHRGEREQDGIDDVDHRGAARPQVRLDDARAAAHALQLAGGAHPHALSVLGSHRAVHWAASNLIRMQE